MMENNFNSDIAKEVLTILAYCDDSFIKDIPEEVFFNLTAQAANSKMKFYINKNKSLKGQNISDETMDLLSTLYFLYNTDSKTKEELLESWLNNEKELINNEK